MINRVLWTLDSEIAPTTFERLCTDLMSREGFTDIIPVGGTHDRGRDAECCTWKGIKSTGGRTFFQYTLEKEWENKLNRELRKVHDNKHEIEFYAFLTTQSITGNKRDKLRKQVSIAYGWQLLIYEREWFRHRLEESHTDLAAKYLGISVTAQITNRQSKLTPPSPEVNNNEKAWELYIQGKHEAAILEFKELLKRDKNNIRVWQALAWCQYSACRYNEAIVSINQALTLNEADRDSLSVKACILTEDGVQRGLKANLLIARDIFKKIVTNNDHWNDHYNYGNVLQALGDFKDAKAEFLLAISLNPAEAEIWKNLGSVYFHLGDHTAEIDCYDKALALNSNLPEAMIGKGVTLLKVFEKKQEAAELIERGIRIDESIAIKWPHAWYWLAIAHFDNNDYNKAFEHVEAGLSIVPYHLGLLNLKASVLSKLWREDKHYIEEAVNFFKFRLELLKDSYDSIVELFYLYKALGQDKLAWSKLADFLDLDADRLSTYFAVTGHDVDDLLVSFRYLPAYKAFRKNSRIEDYAKLLNNVNLLLSDDFYDASFIVYGIPFGIACDYISKLSEGERPDGIGKIKKDILSSLTRSLPLLAAKSIKSINTQTSETAADGFTAALMAWPDIGLMEFSRQTGYIGAIFGVPLEILDKIIINEGKNLGEWQREILERTLLEVNNVQRIFKQ